MPNTASGAANDTVINEVQSNISADDSTFYTTAPPEKTIVFNNEIVTKGDDVLAAKNSFATVKNFQILGVQKRTTLSGGNGMRFVTVVNTDILKDADEYGYIAAKVEKVDNNSYKTVRGRINDDRMSYYTPGIYKKNIKESNNIISGDYGKYNTDTAYKYVTLAINDVPESDVVAVRFYVKKGNKVQYAKYIKDGTEYNGCAADWKCISNTNLINENN